MAKKINPTEINDDLETIDDEGNEIDIDLEEETKLNPELEELKRIHDKEKRIQYYEYKTSPSINDSLKLLEQINNYIYDNTIPIFDINNYHKRMKHFIDFINANISKQ